MSVNRLYVSATAVALTLFLAACGSSDKGSGSDSSDGASEVYAAVAAMPAGDRLQAIIDGAEKEGKVVIYSSRDSDLLDKMKASFTKEYPKVDFQYLSGDASELLTRIQQEGTGKNAAADVYMADIIPDLAQSNMVAELHGAMMPEDFPKEAYQDLYINFGPDPSVITWNTNLVSASEAPKGWDDLLDPKWKGKIGMDPDPDHMVASMVAAWGEEKTADYLKKLMANDPILRPGHSNIRNLLAAGEFPVAAELYGHDVSEAIADGAPLEWAAPDPIPNGGNAFGLAEAAPHPYSAALFANFMMSKSGAQIMADDGRETFTPGVHTDYPRLDALVGDPRIPATTLFEDVKNEKTAEDLIKKYVTPAFTGG